jgi:hypothetical protein
MSLTARWWVNEGKLAGLTSTKALLDAELRRLRSKRLEANVREMSALNAARPSGVVSADNGASGLRITVVGVASRVLGNSAMCGEDGARVGASTRSNARSTRRAGIPPGPRTGPDSWAF